MGALASGFLTLADWAKRTSPNGGVEPKIAEILSQTNEILEDAVFGEGNLPTGHRVTIRTGLPAAYWRALNMGVPRSKSTTTQVDEGIGMLESYSDVDVDLAALNGNTEAFRLSEDMAFIESMNQSMAQTLFYGSLSSDPKSFTGLSTRYGAISGAGNAANIIDAGGTGSANTSVWLVVWGENTVFCPFPKGSRAGLMVEDLGKQNVYDSNGNPYMAYRSHYQWKNGLVVKDWRYVVRICNIDSATFAAMSGTQAPTGALGTNILHAMIRALSRIPNINMGRAAFYMNRSVFSLLQRMALEKSQNALGFTPATDQFGSVTQWATFLGIPLRKVDQLLNTEARVV